MKNDIEFVYVPYFNLGWGVAKLPVRECGYRHTPGYNASLTYRGTIYNGDNIYTAQEGAEAYISKEYGTAKKYRYNGFEN